MMRLFFGRLDGAEYRTPDRVARLGLAQVERGVELERLLEFVAALLNAAGRAMDERQILVGAHAVGLEDQSLVEARLQELRRVHELAVLVGSHSEIQRPLAPIRTEHGTPGQSQRSEHEP